MEETGRRQPRHQQIEAVLRQRLASGEWPVGMQLPREVDLARQLAVSRSVLRQALAALERDGLLQRRRRGGTHVLQALPAPIVQDLSGIYGLAQGELAGRVHSRVLAWEAAPATAAARFDGAPVLRAERLRLVDETPLALEEVLLPAALGEQLTVDALAEGSLYAHLAALGWPAVRAEEEVAALALDRRAARLLNQPFGAPALCVARATWGQTGLIEQRRTLYRADRYRLHAVLDGAALVQAGHLAARGAQQDE